jgi:hypothetical protein
MFCRSWPINSFCPYIPTDLLIFCAQKWPANGLCVRIACCLHIGPHLRGCGSGSGWIRNCLHVRSGSIIEFRIRIHIRIWVRIKIPVLFLINNYWNGCTTHSIRDLKIWTAGFCINAKAGFGSGEEKKIILDPKHCSVANCLSYSVVDPKLFFFGSGSGFGLNFGSGSGSGLLDKSYKTI